MTFIPPAHSGSWVSFLERPWVAEAGPLVAAPLEAAGQGVGARLEPKELLLRFFGSHAPFLHSAVQHFSVGLGALVFVGLLESIFDRCFLQPQNGGYPAQNSLGGRVPPLLESWATTMPVAAAPASRAAMANTPIQNFFKTGSLLSS